MLDGIVLFFEKLGAISFIFLLVLLSLSILFTVKTIKEKKSKKNNFFKYYLTLTIILWAISLFFFLFLLPIIY